MEKENRWANVLVDLWDGLATSSNYSSASNIMRSNKDEWDGFLDVAAGERGNVFSSWVIKAKEMFRCADAYNQKRDIIQRVKEDLIWWLENKGSPIDRENIDLSMVMPNFRLPFVIEEDRNIYKEWCDIWLDNLQIEDRDTLHLILIKAMSADNIKVTKKILKNKNLDINLDIEVLKKNKLDIRNIDNGEDNEDGYFPTFKNKFYDPTKHTMKLGFFAISKEMAELLTGLGFNWNVNVCDGSPLLSVIQNREHFKHQERSKIIELVTKFNLESQEPKITEEVFSILRGVKEKEDIDILLNNFNCTPVRSKNGENILHILAKNTPYFHYFFKEYIIEREDLRKLLGVPDNDGRYPIEYFLCFYDSSLVSEEDRDMMISVTKKCGHIEPDWLEVKMLIAENNATYSAVDSAPINIWKQKTPEDFKDCLKTERGLKLMEMAANNFQYPKDEGDHIYYGMSILKYIHPDKTVIDFSKVAKTKNEVKLYLRQSWQYLHTINKLPPHYSSNVVIAEISKTISILTKRAMSLGISVTGMKKDVLENHAEAEAFDETMRMHFNGDEWETLEIAEERYRLKSVTENSYNNTENKSFECGTAL